MKIFVSFSSSSKESPVRLSDHFLFLKDFDLTLGHVNALLFLSFWLFWWISHVFTQPENKCYCSGHLLFLSVLSTPFPLGTAPPHPMTFRWNCQSQGLLMSQVAPSHRDGVPLRSGQSPYFQADWLCKAIQSFPVICYTVRPQKKGFLSLRLSAIRRSISSGQLSCLMEKACLQRRSGHSSRKSRSKQSQVLERKSK